MTDVTAVDAAKPFERHGSYSIEEAPGSNPAPAVDVPPPVLRAHWTKLLAGCLEQRYQRGVGNRLMEAPEPRDNPERQRRVTRLRYAAKIQGKSFEAVLELLHRLVAPGDPFLCGEACPHLARGATADQAKRYLDSLDAAVAGLRERNRRTAPDHTTFNDEWDELQVYERARHDFAKALDDLEFSTGSPLSAATAPQPKLSRLTALGLGPAGLVGARLTADGRRVVSGSTKSEVVILWLEDQTYQTIEHRGVVAVPCPRGRLLASATDEHLVLSDLETGAFIRELNCHDNAVLTLCFTPDGEALVSGGRGELFWHDVERGRSTKLPTTDCIDAIAFVGNGRTFLTAGTSGRITFWDAASKAEVGQMKANAGRTRCLAVSPDGQRVLSGDEFGQVRLWRVEGDGLALETSYEGFGEVWSLAFTTDGHGAFCGSDAGRLALMDLRTGARKAGRFEVTPRLFPGMGPFFVALPDGRRAVSADANGYFIIWEYSLPNR